MKDFEKPALYKNVPTHTTDHTVVNSPKERLVMLPLRMTEKELDERISKIPNTQKKLACNSNFYFTGWDAAKALPTIKATVLELGLVEII